LVFYPCVSLDDSWHAVRRVRRRSSQCRDYLDDGVVGREIQFFPHSCFINSRSLKRFGAITCRDETRQQPTDRFPIEWIVIDKALEPPAFGRAVTRRIRPIGQREERFAVLAGESRPLGRDPEVELRAAGDVKPVDERARVQRDNVLESMLSHRALEVADIRRNPRRIESNIRTRREDALGTQSFLDMVERLRQRMPRFVGLALCPEQREDFITRDSLVSRGSDDGKNRQQPSLPGGARKRLAISRQTDASECVEPKGHHAVGTV
jgi:hypothetical protein